MDINRNLLVTLNIAGEYLPKKGYMVDLFEKYEEAGLVEVIDQSCITGKIYKLSDKGRQWLANNPEGK